MPLYDLRSPLGVAPAALSPLQQQSLPATTAVAAPAAASQQPASSLGAKVLSAFGQTPLPPSLVAARAFAASRAALRAKVARSGQVRPGCYVLPFTLATDKHTQLVPGLLCSLAAKC